MPNEDRDGIPPSLLRARARFGPPPGSQAATPTCPPPDFPRSPNPGVRLPSRHRNPRSTTATQKRRTRHPGCACRLGARFPAEASSPPAQHLRRCNIQLRHVPHPNFPTAKRRQAGIRSRASDVCLPILKRSLAGMRDQSSSPSRSVLGFSAAALTNEAGISTSRSPG